MIIENLNIRNICGYDLSVVKTALTVADHVVCVCEGQRQLFNPTAPSSVIFAGVPKPKCALSVMSFENTAQKDTVTFLVLGIVCPRKNQVWAVQLFKLLKQMLLQHSVDTDQSAPQIKLRIVGARYIRQYEKDYLESLMKEIDGDVDITVLDVTEDVEKHYLESDILLFPSVNEVTPLVILEAMSYGLPVISTNIGGIPELMTHGVEGYLVNPFDQVILKYMLELTNNSSLRNIMGENGKKLHATVFDLDIMIDKYRSLIARVSPPVVLIDMDGKTVKRV